jgi:hypothetical protein
VLKGGNLGDDLVELHVGGDEDPCLHAVGEIARLFLCF